MEEEEEEEERMEEENQHRPAEEEGEEPEEEEEDEEAVVVVSLFFPSEWCFSIVESYRFFETCMDVYNMKLARNSKPRRATAETIHFRHTYSTSSRSYSLHNQPS